jgi:hypothetical protein
LAIACSSILAATKSAQAADGFPYVAYVIDNDTYVRSGPGNQHYATGQLSAGYAVDVYRHDGDGWCAVRPPEGSFSLAPAHQLKILDSRTAEVTAAGVVARVGSSLGDQRNAVQVMLERDELVQIIDPPKPGEPWVKIAPPAGEFRWIASRRLSRTPPTEGAPATHASWTARNQPASQAVPAEAPAGFAHLKDAPSISAAAKPAGTNSTWQPEAPTASTAPLTSPKTSDDVEVVEGSPAHIRLTQFAEAASLPDGTADSAVGTSPDDAPKSGLPRIRFSGLSAGGPLDPRVAELQLKLSQIVVQPPANWKLSGLREETASLLAQEQSPQIRTQLRDLLDRIMTFESVHSRYAASSNLANAASPTALAAMATPQSQSAAAAPNPALTGQSAEVIARAKADLGLDNTITPTPGGPATPPAGQTASAGAPAATEALYDAVGTLKPVVSRRDKAPHYALVDDHGDVVTFVTAAADVNLQPYVGKRIGVRGSRGFMPEYRRAHVTASRVTPLEEKLIR